MDKDRRGKNQENKCSYYKVPKEKMLMHLQKKGEMKKNERSAELNSLLKIKQNALRGGRLTG